jgi:hypothetical protein
MAVARPVSGLASTIVPVSRTSSLATSNWVGRNVLVVSMTRSMPPEDALVGAGHPDVALEGRAPRKDLLVGRGHVGVGPQHGSDPAVEVSPHDLLVAGGLGVEIQEDQLDVFRHLGQDPVRRPERAVHRRHEDPSQQAEHAHALIAPGAHDGIIASGGLAGIVGRLDDPQLGRQDRIDLAATVDVVAHGQAVHAGGNQLVVDGRRQARSAGHILRIGNDQIKLFLDPQPGHGPQNNLASRLAHNVSDQQQTHEASLSNALGAKRS